MIAYGEKAQELLVNNPVVWHNIKENYGAKIVWLKPEEIYDEKSDRQTLWKAFLKKGDIKHVSEKLSTTAGEIEKFLIKPLDAIRRSHEFNKKWKARV